MECGSLPPVCARTLYTSTFGVALYISCARRTISLLGMSFTQPLAAHLSPYSPTHRSAYVESVHTVTCSPRAISSDKISWASMSAPSSPVLFDCLPTTRLDTFL